MKSYAVNVILLLLIVKAQSQLECYSCDDCEVINQRNFKLETCDFQFERLVLADSLEGITLSPETTTTDDATEEQTESFTIISDTDMDGTTETSVSETMTTTETEATTTDFPEKREKRSSSPMEFCYKLLTNSGELDCA